MWPLGGILTEADDKTTSGVPEGVVDDTHGPVPVVLGTDAYFCSHQRHRRHICCKSRVTPSDSQSRTIFSQCDILSLDLSNTLLLCIENYVSMIQVAWSTYMRISGTPIEVAMATPWVCRGCLLRETTTRTCQRWLPWLRHRESGCT